MTTALKPTRNAALAALACAALAGCSVLPKAEYDSVAHRPRNPDDVRVKVSLRNQMIYVMEGNRPLLVTATTVGTPDHPTPRGHFRVTNKIERKRSYSYGYWVKGNQIASGTSSRSPLGGGRYVGYPMPYWVEFKPAYGFHEGWVWPVPHTHGCLRVHRNVAPKFFALTRPGTPVHIAESHPEDATIGRGHERPQDYRDPDRPNSVMISAAAFERPARALFAD